MPGSLGDRFIAGVVAAAGTHASGPTHETRPGCPVCQGLLEFTTDGLTGRTRSRCLTCERRQERAARASHYLAQAMAVLAARYALTPAEVDRRLRRKRRCANGEGPVRLAGGQARTYREKTCRRCDRTFLPTGPNAKDCPSCRPVLRPTPPIAPI